MVDCGDLEKLPPEIRNEIYALVLVQADPLTLCNFGGDQKNIGEPTGRAYHAPRMKNQWARSDKLKVAPVGHNRSLKGRGYKCAGSKWVEVPSNVALLCVNSKVQMEAAPVLYSRTKFRFKSGNAMRRFLNSIGDNIQNLCDVGICARGWHFRGFKSAREAVEALVAAKDIHTLEVSHVDICPKGANKRQFFPGSDKVVKLCRPLLESLKIAYEANGLKANILEVIKVDITNPLHLTIRRHGDCD
ncbi:hypothetical protein MBLNU13_g04318t1 [Cladosporium sp. NU13]